MTITRNFKLCLNAGTQNAPYINANQYDEGEEWVFDLYTEGGQKFTPSTGAIIGIKSDGHAILNSGTVNSDGQVVITETQQMTAASGLAVFELLIEGETHGTANFIVNVERRPSDDAEFSDSDLSMLQEAIDAAEVINEILDEGGDPSEVIGEHVDAWLDNHPEATTTVEDGAITAPKINNSLWDKLLVNEEAIGNPASFEDGADDVPVSSLKVALEPIQTGSGDPSPSNIRPISGHSSVTVERTGKNILDINNTEATQNVTFTGEPNDFTLAATSTYCFYSIQIPCKANQPVTVRFNGSGTGDFRRVYISHPDRYSNLYISWQLTDALANYEHTFTPTEDLFTMTFYVTATATTGEMHIKNLQAEYGTTATSYESYVLPVSCPISLGREVYGGSVDLATGVLTLTKGFKNITASDNIQSIGSSGHGWQVLNSSIDIPPLNTGTNYSDGVICDRLKSEVGASSVADDLCFINTSGVLRFNLATVYADKTALFNVLGEINVAYPIEPQTIQLTPTEVKTLLGYNNISSTGTVDVIYHADTKLYVDKMTAVDNNVIAPTEATFTATRNYTVNDLVIVNDTLYKCTANIATGSAITPNSNVTQTTLGALIKALS